MNVLALDIGGANIKAAHSQGGAWTLAFALSQQPDQLTPQLRLLTGQAPPFDRLAVTLTAELCDCFSTKRQGVCHVLDAAQVLAGPRPVGVWTTDGQFVAPDIAKEHPLQAAAANWHALATFVATQYPQGLSVLIDCGSTTTDIIPLHRGSPQPTGLTDMDRLASGELVYLGAKHTPLFALGPTIDWNPRNKKSHGLMAEPFATTGDVFLLTGHTSENSQDRNTPDGQPMLRGPSATRLVRMIGADLDMLTMDDATHLAHAFEQAVYQRIAQAMTTLLVDNTPDRVVTSGSGDFIASAAAQITWPTVPQIKLADPIGHDASNAACAYALVQLASDHANAYWNPPCTATTSK